MLTVALQHCGARPVVRDRRRAHRVGGQRPRRHRRRVRRRGRRERRLVPRLLARPARSSPTSRPTTSTTTARRRPVDAAFDASPRGCSRAASSSPAPTTRAPSGWPRPPASGGCDVRTYGESAGRRPARRGRWRPAGMGSARSTAVLLGRRLGRVRLRVPGRHNALNAAAALAAGVGLGLPGRAAARGAGRLHRHPPAVRAQGHGGRRAGLRQLRPPPDRDDGRPARRPRRRRAAGGWWWCSSRTCSAAPQHFAPRASARRSGWPTRSS